MTQSIARTIAAYERRNKLRTQKRASPTLSDHPRGPDRHQRPLRSAARRLHPRRPRAEAPEATRQSRPVAVLARRRDIGGDRSYAVTRRLGSWLGLGKPIPCD